MTKITFKKTNRLYKRILDSDERFIVNYGGAGSGKSHTQTQVEITKALQSKEKILVIRKVSNTLNDSVVSLFMRFLKKLPGTTYNKTEKHLTLPNGSEILFKGLDDPERIKSIAGITRVWIEEATELLVEDFRQLNLRLRGAENLQMSLTFNPISIKHWLHDEFFENEREDSKIFKTTYKDNKYIDDAYIDQLMQLKELDENLYRVYVLGDFGIVRTGMEWASKFSHAKHVKECHYNPDLPIHVSFDFNSKPFLTCIVNQIESDDKTRVRQLKEFCMAHPRNTTEEACEAVLNEFEPYGIAGIFYYGDSTGRNNQARKTREENFHHYDVVERVFKPYLNNSSDRVMSSNPPLVKSRNFYQKLLAGVLGIEVEIDPSCTNTINDFETVKEDANGGILKEKAKDATGAVYEKVGHTLDAHRYFCISVFYNLFE